MRTFHARLLVVLLVVAALRPSVAAPTPSPDASLPVLRSHTKSLDVRDGPVFSTGLWQADPATALDVFVPRRSATPRRVTFFSDCDSLSFDLAPGTSRDFVVRIDDSLACRTRISAIREPAVRERGAAASVEVPFVFGRDHKLHVRGRVNGSAPLDFMFDTGAHAVELSRGAHLKDAKLHFDRTMEFRGTGGSAQGHASDDNTFALGALAWSHEPVEVIDQHFPEFDGILGFSPFEDRVVELDFTRKRFVVHDSLPALGPDWVRLPLEWRGTLPSLDVVISTPKGPVTHAFVLDTGSNATLNFGPSSSAALRLSDAWPLRGHTRASGVGAHSVRLDRYLAPSITLAGVPLPDVPVLAQPAALADREVRSTIGLELLRRFDLVIDYGGNAIYLRPNAALGEPYPRRVLGGPPIVPLVLLAGLIAAAVVVATVLFRARSGDEAAR